MKILVVVPAYNEEKTIKDVVQSLKKFNFEIVVVDDGSTDRTGKLAQEAGAILLRHLINFGPGAAIKNGCDFARQEEADIVVTFDADGQHLAEDVPLLIQPILIGRAEIVNGTRFFRKQVIPLRRIILNQIANLATFVLFGIWLTDSQSGLKAFSRAAFKKIEIKSNSFAWASEIASEVRTKKIRFLEVPIRVRYSDYSLSKGQNFFVGLRTFLRLLFKKLLD